MRTLRPLLIILLLAPPLFALDPVAIGRVATPDGNTIVYDTRGAGDPVLVFVHCWACDRTIWDGQVSDLAMDHRVVTIDLPGHGESTAERETWSIEGLADDVRLVVEELDLEHVVLIGHSMGGPVSLAAAALMPERVQGIIAVDTLHDVDQDFPEEQRKQIVAAFTNDYEGTVKMFVPMMFHKDADPELVQSVIRRALAADRTAAVGLMDDFGNISLPGMMKGAGVPVRAINAAPMPPMQPPTSIENNRRYGDFDAVLIDGVGHFIQLEKPAEVTAAIREFLKEL